MTDSKPNPTLQEFLKATQDILKKFLDSPRTSPTSEPNFYWAPGGEHAVEEDSFQIVCNSADILDVFKFFSVAQHRYKWFENLPHYPLLSSIEDIKTHLKPFTFNLEGHYCLIEFSSHGDELNISSSDSIDDLISPFYLSYPEFYQKLYRFWKEISTSGLPTSIWWFSLPADPNTFDLPPLE